MLGDGPKDYLTLVFLLTVSAVTRSNVGYNGAVRAVMQWIGVTTNLVILILVSKLPRMEAHLCVRNNSYLIFVRNFQKNEPDRRSGFKKRTGTPFRCVPVQFEPCFYSRLFHRRAGDVGLIFYTLDFLCAKKNK